LSVIVGPDEILQHTPFKVIGPPPSEVTLPPEEAADIVIDETIVVLKAGRLTVATGVKSKLIVLLVIFSAILLIIMFVLAKAHD
jgi:hypothetical protein